MARADWKDWDYNADDESALDSGDEMDQYFEGDHLNEQPAASSAGEMHEIIPLLWIGDFHASQHFERLAELGISVIVAAMKQRYPVPDGITVHRVPIEDNDRTNVVAHFDRVNEIIHDAHERKEGVLVHCQAGISRSTTLVAAFLMREQDLTCDEAVQKISIKRSVVKPTEFFLHQLEMYERMGCDTDPAHHSEYRRFLMNFHHESIMDGDGGEPLYLAYYPSPAPTPRSRSPSASDPFNSLRMTPFDAAGGSFTALQRTGSGASTVQTGRRRPSHSFSATTSPRTSMTGEERPERRRSSRMASASVSLDVKDSIRAEAQAVRDGKAAYLKVGLGRVVVKGKRLRCKMCNRELVARQHIVEHDPGQGQQAFAPRRRDMVQFRSEAAQRRVEEADRVARRAANAGTADPPSDREAVPIANADRSGISQASLVMSGRAANASAEEDCIAAASPDRHLANTHGESSSRLAERLPAHLAGLRVALPPPFRPPSHAPSAAHANGEVSPNTPSPPLLRHADTCHSYFVEPLSWMAEQLASGELGGRLTCPNARCQAKLGSFDWAGSCCSCGAWVVPAFALHASKVDEVA